MYNNNNFKGAGYGAPMMGGMGMNTNPYNIYGNPMVGGIYGGHPYMNNGANNIINKKKVIAENSLTDEEKRKLMQAHNTTVLNQMDLLRGKCTHIDGNGNYAFNIDSNNKGKCTICDSEFQIKSYKKEELVNYVNEIKNALHCVKVSSTEFNPVLQHLYEYSALLDIIPTLTVNSVEGFIKNMHSGGGMYNGTLANAYNNVMNGMGSYNPMMGGNPYMNNPMMGGGMQQNPMMGGAPQIKFYYDQNGIVYVLDQMGGLNQTNLQAQTLPNGAVGVVYNGVQYPCEPYGANPYGNAPINNNPMGQVPMMGGNPYMGNQMMGNMPMGAQPMQPMMNGAPQATTQATAQVAQGTPQAAPATQGGVITVEGKQYKINPDGTAVPVQ